ncbi:MAG: tetratricopeptide repeat protein [Planctomycetota bacterium]|nr:tetratricopeptide repeat protein [Planctomycetota bacterium]
MNTLTWLVLTLMPIAPMQTVQTDDTDDIGAIRKELTEIRKILQEEKIHRLELEIQVKVLLIEIKDLKEQLKGSRIFPPKKPPAEKPPKPVVRDKEPAPTPPTERERRVAERHGRAGVELTRERKWAHAVEELSEAHKTFPDHPDILYNRGLALNRLERNKEALRDLDRLIELGVYPEQGRWSVYFERGLAHHGLESYDDAIKDYLRCTRLDPSHSGTGVALYNVACAHALKGNLTEAIGYLQRAVQKGFEDFKHMAQDEDLKVLHGNPRFEEILGQAREI